MWFGRSPEMIAEQDALPGRPTPMAIDPIHLVLGTSMKPPFPSEAEVAYLAMGCFWGAERIFWTLPGVITTAVGYQRGFTPNPTYEEVCSGRTGHTEAVLVAFDPKQISFEDIVARFFEGHDPTQGFRQGNDVGTQYRSAITTTSAEQLSVAEAVARSYAERLLAAGHGAITTEIGPAGEFFYAEDYHQQYLAKNPNGYCGIGGTGVTCPTGLGGLPG